MGRFREEKPILVPMTPLGVTSMVVTRMVKTIERARKNMVKNREVFVDFVIYIILAWMIRMSDIDFFAKVCYNREIELCS